MTSPPPLSPVYVHARREAVVILGLFAITAVWVVGFSWWFGYPAPSQQPAEPALVLGMPAWVFWGIVVPWLVVDVVIVWFCFVFMTDDDLGEAHEGEDLAEQRGEAPADA